MRLVYSCCSCAMNTTNLYPVMIGCVVAGCDGWCEEQDLQLGCDKDRPGGQKESAPGQSQSLSSLILPLHQLH